MNFLPDVRCCAMCAAADVAITNLAIYSREKIPRDHSPYVARMPSIFRGPAQLQHPRSCSRRFFLGYLDLGQPTPTLSGCESHRIKLVTELAKGRRTALGVDIAPVSVQHTLYVPTSRPWACTWPTSKSL